MSFCRKSGRCDLYIFEHVSGGYVCMWCPLLKYDDFRCSKPEHLKQHVLAHQAAGHQAPYDHIFAAIRISEIESDTTRDNTQGKSSEEVPKLG